MNWFWFLMLSAQCLLAQAPYVFDIASAGESAASTPTGTNGVLWWTNGSSTAFNVVDPTFEVHVAEDVIGINAVNCTNLDTLSFPNNPVATFYMTGCTAITFLAILSNAPLAKALMDTVLISARGAGMSNGLVAVNLPTDDGSTNWQVLKDQGCDLSLSQNLERIMFTPYGSHLSINGSAKLVNEIWAMAADQVFQVARNAETHNDVQLNNTISLTNVDFNGDGFSQGTIDGILTDLAGTAPANGYLDLRNMVPPTDGELNADYQTLTNNGWTVLLTP